jgi:hypothetical protein
VTADPILALESLGYTEREAEFLYLVAVHSGYFLRRQFDYFIDRQRGAIAQHFLEKVRAAGHAGLVDYGESRYVYHLFAKPIYRMLGNADSQNRRWKGDGQIRARLMALDCVLENEDDHYLVSEAAKVQFFAQVRGIPDACFTDRSGRLLPLLATLPISVTDRTMPATSPVRFVFADEALLTEEKLRRFLTTAESLLRAVGTFEVIYASTSAYTFPLAEDEFWKRFDDAPRQEQRMLSADWKQGPSSAVRQHPPLHAKFTTLLLKYNYPQIRRKELPSLNGVRQPGLSSRKQVTAIRRDTPSRGSNAG